MDMTINRFKGKIYPVVLKSSTFEGTLQGL
jgi:hypothetical protein